MPDAVKDTTQQTQTKDPLIVDKHETVEVLDSTGKTMEESRGAKGLAAAFTDIAKTGTAEKKEAPVVEKKEAKVEKKEPVVEKKEAVIEKKEQTESQKEEKAQSEAKTARSKLKSDIFTTKDEVEKKDAPVVDESEAAEKEDDVTDEELTVLPHDKPKTARRIKAILRKADEALAKANTSASETEKLKKELEDARKATKDPASEEAIKKQQEELSMYRRRYQLDSDPEIKKALVERFDSKIEDSDKQIIATLKSEGLDEGIVKIINDSGGFVNFSKTANRQLKLADGTTMSYAAFADEILNNINSGNRETVRAHISSQINAKEDKRRYIEGEVRNANEYFTKQEKQHEEQRKQVEVRQKEVTMQLEGFLDKTLKETEWLQPLPLPSDADEKARAAVTQENEFRKSMRDTLTSTLKSASFEEILESAVDSVAYYNERRKNQKLQIENNQLKDRLKKSEEQDKARKVAGGTIAKGTISGAGGSQTQTAKEPKKAQTLEEAFSMVASGKDPTKADDES